MPTIDLNADVAEGYDDGPLLPLVTSANVCCGAHAGDLQLTARTVQMCQQLGVAVGAHPGWPDRTDFGRRPRHDLTLPQIEALILGQLRDLQAICDHHGVALRHVKVHGALANQAAEDVGLALAIGRAIRALRTHDPPRWTVMPHTQLQVAAQQLQLPMIAEAYVDRTYRADGQLTQRSESGSIVHDPTEAATRAVQIALRQALPLTNATWLPAKIETLCIHGDTPTALAMATAVRAYLAGAGFTVAALV